MELFNSKGGDFLLSPAYATFTVNVVTLNSCDTELIEPLKRQSAWLTSSYTTGLTTYKLTSCQCDWCHLGECTFNIVSLCYLILRKAHDNKSTNYSSTQYVQTTFGISHLWFLKWIKYFNWLVELLLVDVHVYSSWSPTVRINCLSWQELHIVSWKFIVYKVIQSSFIQGSLLYLNFVLPFNNWGLTWVKQTSLQSIRTFTPPRGHVG